MYFKRSLPPKAPCPPLTCLCWETTGGTWVIWWLPLDGGQLSIAWATVLSWRDPCVNSQDAPSTNLRFLHFIAHPTKKVEKDFLHDWTASKYLFWKNSKVFSLFSQLQKSKRNNNLKHMETCQGGGGVRKLSLAAHVAFWGCFTHPVLDSLGPSPASSWTSGWHTWQAWRMSL